MKIIRYFTQSYRNIFSLKKCNLIDIHKNGNDIIYDYQYDNDDKNHYFTIKKNNFNNYTFIEIYNLCQTNKILYLDSYLHFFNKYHNNIVLYSPNLQKIYDELSYENIIRNNNKFIVYDLDKLKYSNIMQNIGHNWFYH
jgi:hypothetical protein